MRNIYKAIIIDDDTVNNRIVEMSLSRYGEIDDLRSYTSAIEALKDISIFDFKDFSKFPTIILLDINMPIMSGWEFLNAYDKLDDEIKKHYAVYMLSSSIDWNDREMSKNNSNVCGYFVKPLLQDKIMSLLNSLEEIEL